MRNEEFFRKGIWAHFLRRVRAAKNRAFRCNSSARLRRACGIYASIPCAAKGLSIILLRKIMTSQDAWASSDFALAKS
jgi:hypothetical protein